ncbi:flagellar basal-body rod protein FlgF [Gilvimarinus sp. SDUM040013]|uniref:Flagellar basal-body rod protein FlgF n=1 Tax=Gilvimarinus gilvus TaxID=3058038 RepID=A0ABU4RW95_9GAMM|nr:flagellar basal-body rod protein FlgF [Gilvimarinus sp. SDUM040013]MDO3385081.1 flagellar basal-body rod protein FlgF [Gilvimarinus sp. SDUM040013]MDX6848456.1 flagellar basal-body rod protein FlgF [Gilvimarinus sp. SDUM040013]
MDKALYLAMTGAKHNMMAQANHANNMANVNTTGFRADFAQARAMGVYYGDGQPTRAYALTESPATDFEKGPINVTDRDLDVAINGDGFFAVQSKDGSEAYTRAGDFQLDTNGILRTGNGLAVMGNNGPIALPPIEKVAIGSDGTVSIVAQGEGPETLVAIDRIKLVLPELGNLEKSPDGLFRDREQAVLPADANVQVTSGALEGSNVNAVDAFTDILTLSRQYEMQIKLMKSVEQNSESSSSLLRMS